MKTAVEIVSGTMIYVLNYINIGSGIQKLMRGIHRHTDNIKVVGKVG